MSREGEVQEVEQRESKERGVVACTRERRIRRAMQARRPAWSRVFLKKLGETGNDLAASKAAGIPRAQIRRLEAADEAFALEVQDAREEYADRVEAEADRRARLGWDEPVYQLGKMVGHIRKYDSNLMRDLLAAVRPAKFRAGVAVGGPTLVFVERRDSGGMAPETWAERYRPKVTAEIRPKAGEGEAGGEDPRGGGGAVPRFTTSAVPRASIPALALSPGGGQDPCPEIQQASGDEGSDGSEEG